MSNATVVRAVDVGDDRSRHLDGDGGRLSAGGMTDGRSDGRQLTDSAVWAGRSHFRRDAACWGATISGDGDRRPSGGAADVQRDQASPPSIAVLPISVCDVRPDIDAKQHGSNGTLRYIVRSFAEWL